MGLRHLLEKEAKQPIAWSTNGLWMDNTSSARLVCRDLDVMHLFDVIARGYSRLFVANTDENKEEECEEERRAFRMETVGGRWLSLVDWGGLGITPLCAAIATLVGTIWLYVVVPGLMRGTWRNLGNLLT